MKYIKITTDDKVEAVELTEVMYEAARKDCGGYLDAIDIGRGLTMYFDDEGKFKKKQANKIATLLARENGIAPDDWIVGDVVICALSRKAEMQALSIGMTLALLTYLEAYKAKAKELIAPAEPPKPTRPRIFTLDNDGKCVEVTY